MSHQPSSSSAEQCSESISRRRLLASTAAAGSVAVAGCSAVADYVAGLVLDDVNLFNATDQTLSGEISITDPDGSVVLTDQFDIEPEDDEDDDSDADSGAVFEDVIDEPGEYEIEIELDDDSAIDDATDADSTVSVTDPAEEHIIVVLGAEADTLLDAFVIEEFTEIEDHIDDP